MIQLAMELSNTVFTSTIERGIRENAQAFKASFLDGSTGFKNYFAVKALSQTLSIFKDCLEKRVFGADC